MSVKRTVDYDKYMVDVSMGATVNGDSTNILHTDRVAYQIAFTGTPTGTFTVEVSNDEETWESLTLSVPVTAAGSADNHFIDCETAAKFIRLVYTRSSSTGTLNVKLIAKSISG